MTDQTTDPSTQSNLQTSLSSQSLQSLTTGGRERNLYRLTEQQLAEALKLGKDLINPQFSVLLSQPRNEIIVNFPVKLDDGTVKLFKGYRVQHSNILGPYKGGLRFHSGVYLDECKALALWMSLKCSLQKLPFGGGKGGIKFNPYEHSQAELERISKGFCRALYPYIGQDVDIPAPDMGTNSQIMDWMTHMYQSLDSSHNSHGCGIFTGKSIECGGSQGREEATGRGVVTCIQEWARENNVDLRGKTYIIQGFGNVGSNTAMLLSLLGMSCVGVGDHTVYLASEEGFNIHKLRRRVKEDGCLKNYGFGQKVTKDEFFSLKCDIVIPAALELQICGDEAKYLNCELVVEAANGPLDMEASQILDQRGIPVIPDILANSGGVVVSYYEWLQNRRFEYWPLEKINHRLETQMIETYRRVSDLSRSLSISLRMAAYILSMQHLQDVYSRKRTLKNVMMSYDM